MDSLEAIRRAQATRLVSEDGDEVEFELAPGLLPADILTVAWASVRKMSLEEGAMIGL
jgi:hypothetical protein